MTNCMCESCDHWHIGDDMHATCDVGKVGMDEYRDTSHGCDRYLCKNETTETTDDILREMRTHGKDGEFVSGHEVARIADRIEAAAKELYKSYSNDLAVATAEIKKLRAALRPVLACPCTANTTADEAANNCMTAVIDSLHIWRTGGEA